MLLHVWHVTIPEASHVGYFLGRQAPLHPTTPLRSHELNPSHCTQNAPDAVQPGGHDLHSPVRLDVTHINGKPEKTQPGLATTGKSQNCPPHDVALRSVHTGPAATALSTPKTNSQSAHRPIIAFFNPRSAHALS